MIENNEIVIHLLLGGLDMTIIDDDDGVSHYKWAFSRSMQITTDDNIADIADQRKEIHYIVDKAIDYISQLQNRKKGG